MAETPFVHNNGNKEEFLIKQKNIWNVAAKQCQSHFFKLEFLVKVRRVCKLAGVRTYKISQGHATGKYACAHQTLQGQIEFVVGSL